MWTAGRRWSAAWRRAARSSQCPGRSGWPRVSSGSWPARPLKDKRLFALLKPGARALHRLLSISRLCLVRLENISSRTICHTQTLHSQFFIHSLKINLHTQTVDLKSCGDIFGDGISKVSGIRWTLEIPPTFEGKVEVEEIITGDAWPAWVTVKRLLALTDRIHHCHSTETDFGQTSERLIRGNVRNKARPEHNKSLPSIKLEQ